MPLMKSTLGRVKRLLPIFGRRLIATLPDSGGELFLGDSITPSAEHDNTALSNPQDIPLADVTLPLTEWLRLPPAVAQSTSLIDRFHLSPKLMNALKRNAVNTLEQLSALTPHDLLAMRNVGPGYVKEIVDTLTNLTSAASRSPDSRWPPLDGCLGMMHGEPAQAPAGPSGLGVGTDQDQRDPVTVPIALSEWLTLPPYVAQSALPLKRLRLSAQVSNALEFNRVETVTQLSSLSPYELFSMPRIGRESIKEIMAVLTQLSAQTPESLDPAAILFGDLYRGDIAVALLQWLCGAAIESCAKVPASTCDDASGIGPMSWSAPFAN